MEKILVLGKIDYNENGKKNCAVEIKIKLEDGRLSMMGGIWNPRNTDYETCGQCYDTISKYFPRNKKVQRLIEIWKRWHLNDMRAGDAEQEAFLRDNPIENGSEWFDKASKALEQAGLNPHKGYKFGSAWLKEELPGYVISELIQLSDAIDAQNA